MTQTNTEGMGEYVGNERMRVEDTRAQLGRPDSSLSYLEIYNQEINLDNINIFITQNNPDLGSTFILGNPNADILGTDILGQVWTGSTRINEIRIYDSFTENFTGSEYNDSSFTTVSWTNTGSILFSKGQEVNYTTTATLSTGSSTPNIKVADNKIVLG